MTDTDLLRLQYEYLNTPLAQIAKETGVPLSVVEQEAKNNNWQQVLPDTISRPAPNASEDDIALFHEQFADAAQKRLKIYNLAKELLLAHRYLTLENSILVKAREMAESQSPLFGPKELKLLSGLYKDLVSGTALGNISAISITQDENGIPTAIIRDLSGQK